MSENAITINNISKHYLLGNQANGSLKETLSKWFSKDTYSGPNDFWALKDVTFNVKRGGAIGIIGKNGAGKSTLLKVLSRITEPTTGRIEINGRVSSLLEVGTGFHPELTGRENVFLNGTILGMSRNEVKSKFDEIIDFSGIEKFIDTPVKRYSSGMKVRLGFAVAAHLDPEIMIIDEVLAVGDAEFQRKCLGKMKTVTGEGRTIIFVSHNIAAVKSLCDTGVLLSNGQVQKVGVIDDVANEYSKIDGESSSLSGERYWSSLSTAPGGKEIKLRSIKLLNHEDMIAASYYTSNPIKVEITYVVRETVQGARIIFQLLDLDENVVFSSTNQSQNQYSTMSVGSYRTVCEIPANLLTGGRFKAKVHIGIPSVKVLLEGKAFLEFDTILSGNNGSTFTEKWPGIVAPKLDWSTEKYSENYELFEKDFQ